MSTPISAAGAPTLDDPALDADLDLDLSLILRPDPEEFPYEFRDSDLDDWQQLRSWAHAQILLSYLGSSARHAFVVFQRTDTGRSAQVLGSTHLLSLELLTPGGAVFAAVGVGNRPPARIQSSAGEVTFLAQGEALTAAEAFPIARRWLETGRIAPPWSLRAIGPGRLAELPRIGNET
jgi:hypothetical protein